MSSIIEPVTAALQKPQANAPPEPNPTHPAFLPQRSLIKAVWERRAEYTVRQKIRIKIGSWNVAACSGVEKDLRGWFVQSKGISHKLADLSLDESQEQDHRDGQDGEKALESVAAQESRASKKTSTIPLNDHASLPGDRDIGLYVLGLQEVVDISSAAGVLYQSNDPSIAKKWKHACTEALPVGYELVAEQQLSGMLLLVYASPAVIPTVTSVSTTSVGTGLMGLGNKGGVVARLLLGDTTRLVFVNSHLAAGTEPGNLERRNWDSSQIVQRTKFSPIDHGNGVIDEIGESIGDEDFCFWFGDLNYRLGTMPGEDVRRLLMLHTRNEYDDNAASLQTIDKELSTPRKSTSSLGFDATAGAGDLLDQSSATLSQEDYIDPENDPSSLQTTLSSLLPHDQLYQQIQQRKAFHDGWREGPIKFLPTYKYDIGTVGVFDSSEKKRAPSWCDRILYRTRRDYLAYIEKIKEEEQARKKDTEMKARGLDEDDEVIFDYDPETDGAYDEYDEEEETHDNTEIVKTKEGFEDSIKLEYYTSHQRVLSSDHKPLVAIFELTYDAVDRQHKAKVSAEVARELDKDENESRPQVTVVVDHAVVKDGSAEGINYGDIRYDAPKTHNFTIANTGRVVAIVGFVEDLAKETQHQWLHASFDGKEVVPQTSTSKQYVIEPGETMAIALTIHVTALSDIRSLNTRATSLEDVRVLRVQGGRDHFITIKGIWLPSCFSLSLEELVRVPETGVRSCSLDASLLEQEIKWSGPRELFRLTEALEESLERTVAEWGMKEAPGEEPASTPAGWPFLAAACTVPALDLAAAAAGVRESLDTNAPFAYPRDFPPQHRVEVLAHTLLRFLVSIEGGIVDTELWLDISRALADREKKRAATAAAADDPELVRSVVLEQIAGHAARSVAFTFITFMLARTAGEVAPVHDVLKPGLGLSATAAAAATGKAAEGFLGRVRGSSEDPRVAKRKEVEKIFAEVFEKVMFRVDGESKKEKKTGEERRRSVLAIFLHGKWGD